MAKFPNTVVFNVEFDWKDIRREMVEGFWSIFEQVANSLEDILDDLDAEDQPEEPETSSMATDSPVHDDRGPCSSSHCCNFWCASKNDVSSNHTSWNDVKDGSYEMKHDKPEKSTIITDPDIINIVAESAYFYDDEAENVGSSGSFAAMIVYNLLQEYLDGDFVQDFNRKAQELNIGVELIETDDRDSLDDDDNDETQGGMVWNDFVAKFFPVVPTPLPYSSDKYKWR